MRAVIAGLAVLAVAEGAALMVLLGSGPADTPLNEPAAAPSTVTVYRTAEPVAPPPGGPAGPASTAELPDDVEELKSRVARAEYEKAQVERAMLHMRKTWAEKVKQNEEMRNELESLRRSQPGRLNVEPDPAPGKADDELTLDEARARARHLAMKRHAQLWTVGYSVPDSAGFDAAQAAGVESAMSDEMRRRDLVLRDFIRAELRDEAPANLAQMSGREMMDGVIRPRMTNDFHQAQTFTPQQHLKLLRGQIGLGEVLGADAWTVRLGQALATMRRQTHGDIARVLPAEQAAAVAAGNLPVGSYRYRDGVMIEIGASR